MYTFVWVHSTVLSHKCAGRKQQYFSAFHLVLTEVHFVPEQSRIDCKRVALLNTINCYLW
jgi:hypothetical protein